MRDHIRDSVGCQTVVTSVTYYCSVVTDLSVSRSVHATEMEPCCPDPFLLSSTECRAVHYGICSSLLKLPTFFAVSSDTKLRNQSKEAKNSDSFDHPHQLQMPKVAQSCTRSKLRGEEDQSALELLAENIESSVKPLLSTLSNADPLDDSTEKSSGESIGELASSLQFHLGNFLAAFRQQQKYEENDVDVQDLNSAFEELKSLSTFVHNSQSDEGVNKESAFQSMTPVSHDKDLMKSSPNKSEVDEESRRGLSENGFKPAGLESSRQCPNIPHSSRERATNMHHYPGSQSLDSSYFPLIPKMEVGEPSKSYKSNPRRDTSEIDDSDILDSLISLMNVSLTGLNSNQHGCCSDTGTQQSKPIESINSRSFLPVNDFPYGKEINDNGLWNGSVTEGPSKNRKPQNITCRRKLTFPEDFSSGNDIIPSVSNKAEKLNRILRSSDPQRSVNGPPHDVKGINHDLAADGRKEGKNAISYFYQDGLPVIPLSDAKRAVPQTRDRHSSSSDYQNLLSSTKASVADRVMALEKCPVWNVERLNAARSSNHHHIIRMEKETEPPRVRFQSSQPMRYRSHLTKSSRDSIPIPKFYFPHGHPVSTENLELQLDQLENAFRIAGGSFIKDNFHVVTKVCYLPLYWKLPLYLSVGSDERSCVTMHRFFNYWKRLTNSYHDDATRFVYILSRSKRPFLLPEDFRPMIQDIIDTHPGLTFLRDSKEFHSRYIDTVIARIFYNVNRSWSGKITALELKKSTFLQVVAALENEDDINQMMDYFSYEHFYVIYCKFWKIDLDHDLLINKLDLKRHNNGDISTRMIERIFSGSVSRGDAQKTSQMRYTDFVWFLLSEEDKRHPRSIEYWFRCMDLDGDGFLSMYELEYFYEEQVQRMESLGIEALPFKDCLCQMLDMVRPKIPGKISMSDLKNCKMTTLFFDTFFNLGKYLEHEQRDPFACAKESDYNNLELSDWCKYAEEEYNFLVCEENIPQYRNDCHSNKTLQIESRNAVFSHPDFNSSALNRCFVKDDDDDYDYADSDADY